MEQSTKILVDNYSKIDKNNFVMTAFQEASLKHVCANQPPKKSEGVLKIQMIERKNLFYYLLIRFNNWNGLGWYLGIESDEGIGPESSTPSTPRSGSSDKHLGISLNSIQ